MIRIRTDSRPLTLTTEGLELVGHRELRASVTNPREIAGCAAYLKFVSNYIISEKATIKPGETIPYGFWLTRFVQTADGQLEAEEYRADASEFISGVSLTVSYWEQQHLLCAKAGATFLPPRPDRKAVISEGVLDCAPVEGIRYPSPEHMSGWWLTTAAYNGDIKSLKAIELYRVTCVRPDLVKFLALPFGYTFESQIGTVSFDEQVANSTP